MRLLLLWGWIIIPGYGAIVGPKEITRQEGSSLFVQCSYDDKYQENKKYWCKYKRIFFSRCATVISTDAGKEKTDGKVSIKDDPQHLTFTVVIREVTLNDAGKYQCGISIFGFDEVFAVDVVVYSGLRSSVSPNPSLQPLSTTSVQQGAKVWETQSPELRLRSSVSPNSSLQPLSTRSVQQGAKVWETQSPELRLRSSVSPNPSLQPLSTRSVQQGAKVWETQSPELRNVQQGQESKNPRMNTPTHEKMKPATFTNMGIGGAIPGRGQETLQTRTQQDVAQAATSHYSSSDMKPRSRSSIPLIRILAPCIILLLILVVVIATILILLARRKKSSTCSGNGKE
ncbi:CMRF35-like molecule 9 isoform X2 [Notamacropus eugenii]|uniref:CMRF35-like molecule 9 isoform X2 n=1 Tax=Notamacropus eugenii TaxID=9315 RepID=UPI003B66E1C1